MISNQKLKETLMKQGSKITQGLFDSFGKVLKSAEFKFSTPQTIAEKLLFFHPVTVLLDSQVSACCPWATFIF